MHSKHFASYVTSQEITYSDLVLPGISAAVYSSLLPGCPPNRVPDASPESTPPSSGRSGRAHCSRDTPPSPKCRKLLINNSRPAWYIHNVFSVIFFSEKRLLKQIEQVTPGKFNVRFKAGITVTSDIKIIFMLGKTQWAQINPYFIWYLTKMSYLIVLVYKLIFTAKIT